MALPLSGVMAYQQPLLRTAKRITFRLQTSDVRLYLFDDVVHRLRSAAVRAGGRLCSGVIYLPRKIRRWTVLRSPHVNKKSREKFWMVNRFRMFVWDAPASTVSAKVPGYISRFVPATVAIRMLENTPGLMAILPLFDTLQCAADPSASHDDPGVGGDVAREGTAL